MLASIQIWGLKKKRLESSGLRYNLFWGYFHFEGSASKKRLADLGSSNRNDFILLPAMPGSPNSASGERLSQATVSQ